jgi:hypothetical protein
VATQRSIDQYPWKRLAEFGFWGLLLGLAYAQSPLYTSNQNQYFLHGIAGAGFGFLQRDWLANTQDPTPLFSWMVQLIYSYAHPVLFYGIYILLIGIYVYSLYGIVSWKFQLADPPWKKWIFFAAMILLHSTAVRWTLGRVVGGEWQYLFDGGVAGQRLLGTVLQPSVFGVLLLLSVQQFLLDNPYRAVIAAVLATWFHPTYLLSAAALTISYVLIDFHVQRKLIRSIAIGFAATLLALPVLLYTALNFFPTAPDVAQILVEFRIPEHTLLSYWLDWTTVFKAALVLSALVLTRKTRLFWILLISLLILLILTLVQWLTGSNSLALLFPWRLSTYLVPISTAILLGWAVAGITDRSFPWFQRHSRAITIICWSSIGLLVLAGLARFGLDLQRRQNRIEAGALNFVQQNLAAGQTYLVPPKLQDFRLETGAPAFIDFKSIPYENSEVRTWYDRLRRARFFYQGQGDCGILRGIAGDYNLTHVLLSPMQVELECEGWWQLYSDGSYAVYRLNIP